MRAIYQRAGRQEGEGQEEKVTTPVSRSHVLWPRTDQRVEHIRARIYKTRTSCGGERDPFLSLSLSLPPPEKGENAGGNNAAEIFVLFLGIVGPDRPSDTAGLGALFPSILVRDGREEKNEEGGIGQKTGSV